MHPYVQTTPTTPSNTSPWPDFSSALTRIFGLSMLASVFTGAGGGGGIGGYGGIGGGGLKLFLLGTVIELGRRLVQWFIERFRLQYSITAEFNEGDPAYDWIINFITQEKVWRRSRDFRVSAKSSQRRWGIHSNYTNDSQVINSAEYVPTYDLPQLFWWKRYCIEIKRTNAQAGPTPGGVAGASIYLTIYTLDMQVLSKLVEEAKAKYYEVSRPHVIVHFVNAHSYGPKLIWNSVKQKPRRPLNSIVLPGGTLNSLIEDVRDFLKMEDWYMSAGIPHRRGYLLYGPPGTGKSSTIHAIAGELGMEIYSISLASQYVDDTFLEEAVSSVPKGSILLIEDIDCAFSRDDEDDDSYDNHGYPPSMVTPQPLHRRRVRRSAVTLSGLLNILDGVGSEEGKIFFATTNFVDSLDAALLRPGRIDKKVEYKLATAEQASALFARFYPAKHVTPECLLQSSSAEKKTVTEEQKLVALSRLNREFTAAVPEYEFSVAELQGFLLSFKMMPEKAVENIEAWVEEERERRKEKERAIEARKAKTVENRGRREVERLQMTLARMNAVGPDQSGVASAGFVIPPTVAIPLNGSGFVAPSTVGKQVNGSDGVGDGSDGSDHEAGSSADVNGL